MTVKCTICDRDMEPDGPWHPFCSHKCKLVDLGRWLGESYRVPVVKSDEEDAEDEPK